ncbi:hypothetical protein ACHWQZ_G002979 [Mnemiopsis leidyi]
MNVYITTDGYTLPSGFIAKEICCMFPNGEFTHTIFKPPMTSHNLSEVDKRTIRYATRNLNNLSFHDGWYPYENMGELLKRFQEYRIYTYSDVTLRLIQQFLPTTVVVNVQDEGFKMPDSLPDAVCFRVHNPRYCAKAKCVAIKNFIES